MTNFHDLLSYFLRQLISYQNETVPIYNFGPLMINGSLVTTCSRLIVLLSLKKFIGKHFLYEYNIIVCG